MPSLSSTFQFLTFLFLLDPIHSAPLHLRTIQSIGYIDPSSDEWSSTLSGLGPLILLIGERSTKQVLRNVRSLANAFSLAAAPLGLLSVVTSLIRFCGPQRLRAYIGYELEARTVIGVEITRVNCGGVHAHLTDGYVVRSIAANPASRLVAVSILSGKQRGVESEALERIKRCEEFVREKRRLGMPEVVANVEWVIHMTSLEMKEDVVNLVVKTLADAVGFSLDLTEFQNSLNIVCAAADEGAGDVETIQSCPTSPWRDISTKSGQQSKIDDSNSIEVSVLEVTPTLATISEKAIDVKPQFWSFTFMNTFDAVSEFTTSTPVSNSIAASIGVASLLSISGVHILALWQNDWIISIGWILVIIGYGAIVLGVAVAAMLIHSSCVCIQLPDTRNPKQSEKWKDGMVVSVKNTDSMDTNGSSFVTSSSKLQNLEAVWIKPSTRNERVMTTIVTFSLVLAFISHYLGLRAIKWWASVGELCICLLASFARSVSNDRQEIFQTDKSEAIQLDKRCMSTGVLATQSARLVNVDHRRLDARAYSPRPHGNLPVRGERVAFQLANLCKNDLAVSALIMRLTGIIMKVSIEDQPDNHRAILMSFNGGLLVSEGLAFPNTQICLAFRSGPSDLGSPTALLARGIMRQPEWRLDHPGFGRGIPLGNVYIFSIQSMMDWWTLSEDRNDFGDLQKNLQWPLFFINVAFFLELLRTEDDELMNELERAQGVGRSLPTDSEVKTAIEVMEYLRTETNKCED